MSRTHREHVDSREPFIPDAGADADWREFERYLDGSLGQPSQEEIDAANAELALFATALNLAMGQLESMVDGGDDIVVIVEVIELEMGIPPF